MLVNRFLLAKKEGIELIDLDASSLAGYYLVNYPDDPIRFLMNDIMNLKVSSLMGHAAKAVVLAAIME